MKLKVEEKFMCIGKNFKFDFSLNIINSSLKMSQKTLESWFTTIETKPREIKNIFYYNGNEAKWITQIPKDSILIKKISWKSRDNLPHIVLCTNKNNTQNILLENQNTNKIKEIAFLKSHLQKCVRRNNVKMAIITSIKLIQLDFNSFIRRLPIIMLEDSLLHESFPFIIWIMSTYPKFVPDNNIITRLLNIVKCITLCPYKDIIFKDQSFSLVNNTSLKKISEKQQSIIYSIYLRKSYGGMEGDMKMLLGFCNIWIDRFINNTNFLEKSSISNENYDLQKLIKTPFNFEDLEISGIDFHCYPRILQLIQNQYSSYTIEDIKLSIWFNSSSINHKTYIKERSLDILDKKQDIWKDIKKAYTKLAELHWNTLSF